MLLIDNFIHADLHPGNIMVRFYQAHQPQLGLPRQSGVGAEGEAQVSPQDQVDVTEQLNQLR